MANSVFFDPSVGGDGSTVTGDSDATTGLGAGGHRTRLLPAMDQVVAVADFTVTQTGADVTAAAASAAAAAASAASAVSAASTNGTSTSSVAIGTGSKAFTTQAGKDWVVGMNLVIAETASPATNSMFGVITAYSGTSLTVNVTQVAGSGTIAAWTISVSGPLNSGVFNETKGADITSASTINLDTASGNLVHVTGTTTITAITLSSGRERTVVFDGALTLTHNATTLILPGGANITTAAGDRMIVRGDGSGNTRVIAYTKASGLAVVVVQPALVLLATLTPTAAANVDFLTTFTSAYDNYLILGEGLLPSADDGLRFRLANGGSADAGSNYAQSSLDGTTYTATVTNVVVTSTVLAAGKGANFHLEIKNVNDATNLKSSLGFSEHQFSATPGWQNTRYESVYFAANAVSGIRFFWTSASNFAATGKIRVYGYSNT